MPFMNTREVYRRGEREGYVVPGFDSYCLEVVQAQIRAASAERSPFLLQVTPKGLRHIGIDYFTGMAKALIQESSVPVALHLDHGTNIGEVVESIKRGFTSVMIDGSALPFDQNVELTRRVVEIAHSVDVTVEAELGRVLGKEADREVQEGEETFTDPMEAEEFIKRTGVDSLAVSVGNVHGFYRGEPFIDYTRLSKIYDRVRVPLVFHGGSGLERQIVQKACELGVRKINIGTLIKDTFTRGVREYMTRHPEEIDPRKVLGNARDAVIAELRAVIQAFGSNGRSWL